MAIYELYDEEIELDFNEKKHIYTVDGNKVISVTGVTGIIDKSGPLMWWSVSQCLDFIKNGLPDFEEMDEVQSEQFFHDAHRAHLRSSRTEANIGTMAHKWIEDYLREPALPPPMPKNPKLLSTVNSWLEWKKQHELTPYETEFKVYSRENNYAGTCDYDGIVSGERCIVDWKTGKAVYPEHALQTAAYQLAREEELDVEYDARWVVVLPKDGGKVIAERFGPERFEQDCKGFLGALDLYRAVKRW